MLNATKKPVMLVSMPSCGSTWIADLLCKTVQGNRPPQKEFFNPALNWKDAPVLREVFGCELYATVETIAKDVPDQLVEEVVTQTFLAKGFTFTKEIYLHFRVDQLRKFFDFVFLVRNVDKVFPPNRGRVRVWYHAMYKSLILNGKAPDVASSIEEQCCLALIYYKKMLEKQAATHNEPILVWDDLLITQNYDDLTKMCGGVLSADEVIATRKMPTDDRRPYLDQWKDALEVSYDKGQQTGFFESV